MGTRPMFCLKLTVVGLPFKEFLTHTSMRKTQAFFKLAAANVLVHLYMAQHDLHNSQTKSRTRQDFIESWNFSLELMTLSKRRGGAHFLPSFHPLIC